MRFFAPCPPTYPPHQRSLCIYAEEETKSWWWGNDVATRFTTVFCCLPLAADDIWLRAVGVAIKFQLLLHFSHTAHAEVAKEMAMGKRPTRMGNENGNGGLKWKWNWNWKWSNFYWCPPGAARSLDNCNSFIFAIEPQKHFGIVTK